MTEDGAGNFNSEALLQNAILADSLLRKLESTGDANTTNSLIPSSKVPTAMAGISFITIDLF